MTFNAKNEFGKKSCNSNRNQRNKVKEALKKMLKDDKTKNILINCFTISEIEIAEMDTLFV